MDSHFDGQCEATTLAGRRCKRSVSREWGSCCKQHGRLLLEECLVYIGRSRFLTLKLRS
jgi:hypothetical protein